MNLDSFLEHHAQVEEFRRRHRTGLATLLFTDIVGSTKLKQTLGDQQGLFLIQQHHSIARKFLGQFKEAEEIKTAGDSFFIIFAKPSDAVKFSLLLQAKLRSLARTAPAPIYDRIGIHVGEVFIEEDQTAGRSKDLFGIQVDTCARVMSLADGDQILMTRFAFDNARQVLKGQEVEGLGPLSWLNHGTYSLKGVEEPLDICEVGETGLARLLAPKDTDKAQRFVAVEKEPVLGWRPAIGQAVPNTQWVLEEKIGEGGFGEVWVGRHQALKKRQVFKFCFRADRVRSLKREVTLFRVLKERAGNHPNIVAVHDVFLNEPPYYLVMDYAEGKDLKAWSVDRGGVARIPLGTRLEIVAQVAEALQAAHDAGVVHRDVKPSNILVETRESSAPRLPKSQIANRKLQITAKLTDFGIGQVVSEEILADVTKAGFTQTLVGPSSSSQTGTFMYMAPELLAGKPASAQSDIYSLGVVFYQLLVGDLSRPVTTDWADEVTDPLLRDDLKRCFAGNPTARFERAGQLAENIRSLAERRAAHAEREAQETARRGKALQEALKGKSAITLDWRQGTVGAALAVLAGWFFLISQFDFGLKALSFDLPFALRRDISPEEARIVYMNDESHRRLAQDYSRLWDRSLHVELVKKLTQWKAKAIVFDILFESSWPDPKIDEQLATAMQAHGKVITAATVEREQSHGALVSRVILPVEPIRSASVSGLVDFPIESDVSIRRRPRYPVEAGYADLPLKIVEALGSRPGDRTRSPWLNFYGPSGIIPHASYYQVFESNALRRDFFSNKVVFVGQGKMITPGGSQFFDEYRTPYTRWTGLLSPGVELQATAFLNLWRGDWLTGLAPNETLVVLGVTGFLFGFGLTMLRTWVAAWVSVAGLCVMAALALWLVWQMHIWFPWLIVCGVQIPCALGWSVLVNSKRLYAERELLREAIPVEQASATSPVADNGAPTENAVALPDAEARVTVSSSASTQIDSAGSRPSGEAAAPSPPVIPDHELIRMIGEGGYGQVWLARDVIGTYHAVKIVYRRKFSNDSPYEREFRGIQKFTPISRTHPGLIHILHVGKNDREGCFFYIMELGDDETSGQNIDPATYSARNLSRELKKRGKLAFAECLELGLALTEALSHLHAHHLIHRDIKPSNIVFVSGRPKFADIGLVTDLRDRSPATTYVGTEGYIPPEGPGTAAGDVYSLGKVLYEASMGKDRKQFPELPTSLAERADCEPLLRLNEVILKACDQNVQARYESAAQMLTDLTQLQKDWRGHAG